MARSSRGSGRRTDYEWFNIGDTAVAQAVSVNATLGVTAFLFAAPATISRLRGKVGVVLDTAAVNESFMVVCGLFIGNADLTNSPELFTNGVDEGSWIWQGALFVNSGAEAAVVTDALSDSIEIDSKAMRRVKNGMNLFFAHQAPAAVSVDQGGTYDISYYVHGLAGR